MPTLDRCIEILEHLVAFPTISRTPNRPLVDWVGNLLRDRGLEPILIPSPELSTANLFVTVGPPGRGGVLLSGHSDVVPVEAQSWSSDPFVLTRKGPRLYGRGTADMKGFIACALTIIEHSVGVNLKTPLHLALSYDEELGCLGVPSLIERLGSDLPMPIAAIVGEPTGLRPVNAHKGFQAFRTTFRGEAAHSCRPDKGISAIRLCGAFLQALEVLAADLRQRPPPEALGLEPPYTTFNVGRIAGGTAVNIVAQECTLEWEFRPSPGDDAEAILGRLDKLIEALLPTELAACDDLERITTQLLAIEPVLHPEPEGQAESLIAQLIGSKRSEGVAYGTEAGLFQAAGISSIVIGPGHVAQAHQADEYVECEQLMETLKLLHALADWATENELTAP